MKYTVPKGIEIMKIREIQEEILRLKKERDFCILAHSYQTSDILEIADFTGDSYALSVKAKDTPQKNVLMCGVRFMAETVKILSPEKNVYLSNPTAGCPMAEQMDKEMCGEDAVSGLYRCGIHQHHRRTENHLRCLRDFFFCGQDRFAAEQ